MGVKIVRLLLMFDLPSETSKNKRDYRAFIKFLKNNGYLMLQYSVYAKLLLNRSTLKFHEKQLKANLPPEGKIQTLIVTENQFASMQYLLGEKSPNEEITISKRILEL